jgi:hypothetical protein
MHEPHTSKTRRLLGRAPRTRSVIAATGLLVICIAPFANAKTGQPLREGVRNGTTTSETEVISNIGSTLSTTGGYSTRQSNLSNTGGGAIYGCRSGTGGSAAKPRPQNPCVRANNLSSGYAFEFNASKGVVGGLISVGAGGDTRRPFITNATGVALGLNADRLDGLDAAAIIAAARTKAGLDADTVDGESAEALKTRWLLVGADGSIVKQTGGFTLVSCYAAPNDNCYIDGGGDMRNKGISAEIATANNPDAGTDGELTGTTSAAPCFFDFVNCGPNGTDSGNGGNAGVFVVTPRNSDGTAPEAGDRYPFYAYVTDSTAP